MATTALPDRIERELARLLKKRRETQKMSKLGTAQKAGLATQTISFVEENQRCPSINTLLRITTALDVDLWAILKEATAAAKRDAAG